MELELVPGTKEILQNVEDLTMKKFKFIPSKEITSHAKLKMARNDMENHIVYYKEGVDQRINHIIAHECGHIMRLYETTPSKRLVPYFSPKNYWHALEDNRRDIEAISKIMPESKLNQLIEMLFKGLVMQLTNQPVDLKIEEWIYNNYPGLRVCQELSFKSQLNEAIGGINEKIRSMTPSKVYEASHSMNYAYFNVLSEKAGFDLDSVYEDFEFENMGRSLIEIMEKHEDNFEGDIKRIDEWAYILNLSSWYEWKKFDDVPSNYEYMI